MEKLLSEERQLIKWVGIFLVDHFRGEFFKGKFNGWETSWGNFPTAECFSISCSLVDSKESLLQFS